MRWHRRCRDGVSLWAADYGGPGPGLLLLHGLAGYGEEWHETAIALSTGHRVVAPDQRGHGHSERRPGDVTQAAFVADAAMWIRDLELAPVVTVGQSLGGDTALLLAAEQADLVRALVLVEATPQGDPAASAQVGRWLESWPARFASHDDALAFFGGDTPWARAWAGGLRPEGDGLVASFDNDVMMAALADPDDDRWDAWASIRCPILVVSGEARLPTPVEQRMRASQPDAVFREVAGAGHDLHIEQTDRWLGVLTAFLSATAGG